MTAARPTVGWIGLGAIGSPMARRVLAAGFPLVAWARRADAAYALAADGAVVAPSPEALAARADVIATIVGGPDDVRALHRRLIPAARAGTLVVDMTTSAPDCAGETAALAHRCGCLAIDAPVTGGVGGAERGTLTAFVGGDPAAIERGRPVLEAFCSRIVSCGSAGAGYRMKLVNQTIVAGTLLGLAGGAALARAYGFASASVKDALGTGTASGFLFDSYIARMMEAGGPTTFTLGLLRKDLALARDEAARCGSPTAFVDLALGAVDAARREHGDGAGVQVLGSPDPG